MSIAIVCMVNHTAIDAKVPELNSYEIFLNNDILYTPNDSCLFQPKNGTSVCLLIVYK